VIDDDYRHKRVLITGHTGFKGSWLGEWLLQMGATVAGFSLGVPTTPSHFELLRLSDRLTHLEGDTRQLHGLQEAFDRFRPEVVFHLAAQAITRLSYDEPKATFDTNLGGTVNVLEAIRTTPSVRVAVLVASDKCYENAGWEYGYRESDPLGGRDPYSASKACAEIAFSAYARSFFTGAGTPAVASVRAGNVIGGGDWALDRIVPDCMRAWTAGRPVAIRQPGSVRPWQHVLDLLSGYLRLGARLQQQREGLAGEAFNFGPSPGSAHSVLALLNEMLGAWPGGAWHKAPSPDDGKPEAALLTLSSDKAASRLQWRPTLAFAEAAQLTAQWYQTFYQSQTAAAACTARQIADFAELARQRQQAWSR
jgi:CDP-glucose 4,6-dehydratase